MRADDIQGSATDVDSGVGAVIKRLCYLARILGIYYDLAYEPASSLSAVHPAKGLPTNNSVIYTCGLTV